MTRGSRGRSTSGSAGSAGSTGSSGSSGSTGSTGSAGSAATSSKAPRPTPRSVAGDSATPTADAPRRHSPFYWGFFGTAGGLLAFWLGQQLVAVGSILVLIVVAMFLAVGLSPAVEVLVRRGFRRGLAVLTVILAVVAALALFVATIVPVITDQITLLVESVPGWIDQLQENERIQELEERYQVLAKARDYIEGGTWTSGLFGGVVGIGIAVVSALTNTFIVVVLTLYFLASLGPTKAACYRLAPASKRTRVAELTDRVLASIGGYVSGAFMVALCAGLTSLVFLLIVGMGEYAVALSFVVGLLSLIPMVGATISMVLVSLVALAFSPTIALICLIYYLAYQQFENYVLYPRVMKRSVDIPGSLTVIAALVGAALLGVIGALLAVPAAAAILLLTREVLVRRQDAH